MGVAGPGLCCLISLLSSAHSGYPALRRIRIFIPYCKPLRALVPGPYERKANPSYFPASSAGKRASKLGATGVGITPSARFLGFRIGLGKALTDRMPSTHCAALSVVLLKQTGRAISHGPAGPSVISPFAQVRLGIERARRKNLLVLQRPAGDPLLRVVPDEIVYQSPVGLHAVLPGVTPFAFLFDQAFPEIDH